MLALPGHAHATCQTAPVGINATVLADTSSGLVPGDVVRVVSGIDGRCLGEGTVNPLGGVAVTVAGKDFLADTSDGAAVMEPLEVVITRGADTLRVLPTGWGYEPDALYSLDIAMAAYDELDAALTDLATRLADLHEVAGRNYDTGYSEGYAAGLAAGTEAGRAATRDEIATFLRDLLLNVPVPGQ
jgi:hypothetical protein